MQLNTRLPDLSKGTPLGVAVSGGGDSMALLHMLHTAGHKVCAATVNHNLRPEAATEAQFVADFCAQRAIPHKVLLWADWDGQGNLQASARRARYALLAEWAQHTGVSAVALGHTADDVAETFLLGLARSAGVQGLAEMQSDFLRNDCRFLRPLLQMSRPTLRAYLTQHQVKWMEDCSNSDPRFDRVKAREILRDLAPLGVTANNLAAVARNLRGAACAIEHAVVAAAKTNTREHHGDLLLRHTAEVPAEVFRQLFTAGLSWVGGGAYPPRGVAVQEAMTALGSGKCHTLGGCIISVEGAHWRIAREASAVEGLSGDPAHIWDGRWAFSGPEMVGAIVRSLGESGLRACPDWRSAEMPRTSLLASPSIWQNDQLLSAPLAGNCNGWHARIARSFITFLESR